MSPLPSGPSSTVMRCHSAAADGYTTAQQDEDSKLIAFRCPRSELPDRFDEEPLKHSGVYILVARPHPGEERLPVYIGKAMSLRKRLDNHIREDGGGGLPDWGDYKWSTVFALSGSPLNSPTDKDLESALIKRLSRNDGLHLINLNRPSRYDSDADPEEVQDLLATHERLLTALGAWFLLPPRDDRDLRQRPALSSSQCQTAVGNLLAGNTSHDWSGSACLALEEREFLLEFLQSGHEGRRKLMRPSQGVRLFCP